jgi:hypothetical protein
MGSIHSPLLSTGLKKTVQLDQSVHRCSGKAVTLCNMRLATVAAERFRGAQLRTDPAKREGTENYPDGGPALRDGNEPPGSPASPVLSRFAGWGGSDEPPAHRPMLPFFAFSLRLVACCLLLFCWGPNPRKPAIARDNPPLRNFFIYFSFAGRRLTQCLKPQLQGMRLAVRLNPNPSETLDSVLSENGGHWKRETEN